MNIGIAIRAARKRAGMTQEEVAEKAGLERNYICKLENGTHDPTLETLSRIGEAVGIEGWKIYRLALRADMQSITRVIDCTINHEQVVP